MIWKITAAEGKTWLVEGETLEMEDGYCIFWKTVPKNQRGSYETVIAEVVNMKFVLSVHRES